MLNGRTELAETRFAVISAQIAERLEMKDRHLQQLLDEGLDIESRLFGIRRASSEGSVDMLTRTSLLEQQQAQNLNEQRRTELECWRDITHVLRDLLNAWEGLSRNRAKNRFLTALPRDGAGSGRAIPPVPSPPFHNDTNQLPNYQR